MSCAEPRPDLEQILQRVQRQQAESQESLRLLAEQHKQWQATIVSLLACDRLAVNDFPSDLPAKVHEVQESPGQFLHEASTQSLVSSPSDKLKPKRKSIVHQMVAEVETEMHPEEEEELPAWRRRLVDFVQSPWFEHITGCIIMCNMITTGIEAEASLRGETNWGMQVERAFLAIYTIELVLRVMANGIRSLLGEWMLLDLFLVVVGFVVLVLGPLFQDSPLRGLDKLMLARGLRLLRLARVLRLSARFKVVWRLVNGLLTAGGTMMSTTALIMLTLFISGCVAVEIITKDPDLTNNPSTAPIVHAYFGSLPKSCLTLLQFVTVDSLASIYYPLIVEKPYLSLFFLPLMILISVCLMNLVTAVLVETSMNFTASEQERERLETKDKIKQALPELCRLFDEWDEDHDGCITRAELGKVPVDHLPDNLGDVMPVDSMSELFDLLDVDETNSLTREEFVDGLLNLLLLDMPRWAIEYVKMLRLIRLQLLVMNRSLTAPQLRKLPPQQILRSL
ncbi:unnamed protein product [Effrenium voratum]|nr:unnamed protein product [Effrenium voratum]